MTKKSLGRESEQSDLWANWHGFNDAEELKEWGEQVERDRQAELAAKKDDD
ncbi:MAG: hypothetical protein ACRBBS_17540 [Thalassovita sp.]